MSKTSSKQRIECFLLGLETFKERYVKKYKVYYENGKQWNGNGIIKDTKI
jgi:hypothetical protein